MTTIARVLALLEEHDSVTTNEFLDARLYKFASRISDLRNQGYIIECTGKAPNFKYHLVGRLVIPTHETITASSKDAEPDTSLIGSTQSTIPLSPNLYA